MIQSLKLLIEVYIRSHINSSKQGGDVSIVYFPIILSL